MKITALRKKQQFGITLVEVVVFVAIFGSALVLLLASVSYSTFVYKAAQDRLLASHNADLIMEWFNYQKNKISFAELANKAVVWPTPVPTTTFECPVTPTPDLQATPPNPTSTPCPEYNTPIPTQPNFRPDNTFCLNNTDFLTTDLADLSSGYCSSYINNYRKELSLIKNEAADIIEAYVKIYWQERSKIKNVELLQKFYKYED